MTGLFSGEKSKTDLEKFYLVMNCIINFTMKVNEKHFLDILFIKENANNNLVKYRYLLIPEFFNIPVNMETPKKKLPELNICPERQKYHQNLIDASIENIKTPTSKPKRSPKSDENTSILFETLYIEIPSDLLIHSKLTYKQN